MRAITGPPDARREIWNADPPVDRYWSLLVFAIPALLSVQLRADFVGTFFLGELLAVLLIVQTIRYRRVVMADPSVKMLWVSGLLWLAALIASDLWQGTSSQVRLKGWGEVALQLTGLVVLGLLVAGRRDRARVALLGLATGYAFRLVFVDIVEPWRLGGMYALALLALLAITLGSHPVQRALGVVVPAILAAAAFQTGARGLGSILVGTAFYVSAIRFFRIRSGAVLTNRQVTTGVSLAIVFAGLVVVAYGWMASAGALGELQKIKYESQNSGELGVMIGGRTSLIGSAIAIADSPFVGHGSRQRDEIFSLRTQAFLEARGYEGPFVGYDTDSLLTHGALLAAWVTSGALGIVFWLVVLRIAFRALLTAHNLSASWQPIVAFVALQVAWDTAFNGFGGFGKLALPTLLLFLITMTRQATAGQTRRRPRVRIS